MKRFLLFHDVGLMHTAGSGKHIGSFDTLLEAEQCAEYLERSDQGNWAKILDRDSSVLVRSGRQEGAVAEYWWTWQDA